MFLGGSVGASTAIAVGVCSHLVRGKKHYDGLVEDHQSRDSLDSTISPEEALQLFPNGIVPDNCILRISNQKNDSNSKEDAKKMDTEMSDGIITLVFNGDKLNVNVAGKIRIKDTAIAV